MCGTPISASEQLNPGSNLDVGDRCCSPIVKDREKETEREGGVAYKARTLLGLCVEIC